jgi:hypothetical protein
VSSILTSLKDLLPLNRYHIMLFRMVSTTDKFFEFIEENKFYGEKGIAAFEDWIPLITQILQGEQFKQHVLNDLITGTQIVDSRTN